MARNFLTVEVLKNDFPDFKALYEAAPELRARMLGFLGKEAAVELAERMERGEQGIQFRDMDGNRRSRGSGHRMATYSVGKNARWVRISSFPLNFFEGGRTLRSGKRERPRKILRRTLRSSVAARMPELTREAAERLIVDDWFNRRHKGGMRNL